MIRCTLCERATRDTAAAGIFVTPDGRYALWQLCPRCASKFKKAGATERDQLLQIIEATLEGGPQS